MNNNVDNSARRLILHELEENLKLLEHLVESQEKNIVVSANLINNEFAARDEIANKIIGPSFLWTEEIMMFSMKMRYIIDVIINNVNVNCCMLLDLIGTLEECVVRFKEEIRELHLKIEDTYQCFYLNKAIDFSSVETESESLRIDFSDWNGLSITENLLGVLRQLQSKGNNLYLLLRQVFEKPNGYIPSLNIDELF